MGSQPPTESDPKGGENEAPEDKVTRNNFEALARGLFRVSPEEYAKADARQKAAADSAKRAIKKRP